MENRTLWIDNCRGIAIFLVIVGHNLIVRNNYLTLAQAIYIFHMPLFFFIAGLTIKKNMDSVAIFNRIASILLPYFFLSFAIIPLTLLKDNSLKISNILLGIFYGTGHTIDLVPMWFLPCLAVALIITFFSIALIERFPNHFNNTWALLIASVFVFSIGSNVTNYLRASANFSSEKYFGWGNVNTSGLFWNAEVAIIGSSFIILGYAASRFLNNWLIPRKSGVTVVVISILFLTILQSLGISPDLNFRRFSPSYICFLGALIGIAGSIALSMLMVNYKKISTPFLLMGRSSLIILWLHNGLQSHFLPYFLKKIPILNEISIGVTSIILSAAIAIMVDKLLIRKTRILNNLIYPRFNKFHEKINFNKR